MGGFGNTLGLLFEISADPSKAEAALNRFNAAVAGSGQAMIPIWEEANRAAANAAQGLDKTRQGVEDTDKSILSSRESVRLLAEEFGIHLPRAVTSAVGEIIPSIAGMGTALLGVFAVEEVIKFAGYVRKLADDFNGVADAAKELKLVGEENLSNMERAAKASLTYARSQATLLITQVEQQRAFVAALKAHEQGLHAINPVIGQIVQAYSFWFGASKDVKQAESDLLATEKARDAVIKILGEDETSAHKKAQEAAEKHARAVARALHEEALATERMLGLTDRLEKLREKDNQQVLVALGVEQKHGITIQEMTKVLNQAGLAGIGFDATLDKLLPTVRQLTDSERLALPTLRELHLAVQKLTQQYPQLTKAEIDHLAHMKLEDPVYRKQIDDMSKQGVAIRQQRLDWQILSQGTRTAISEMTGAIAGWGGVTARVFDQVANQIIRQIELDQLAAIEHQASQVSMMTSTLTALKHTAFYKAYEQSAAGFASLAEYDFWAAAKHFGAATLYGIVAGAQVAAVAGGMGSGGGGGGASARAAGPSSSSPSMGASPPVLAPGSAAAARAAAGGQPPINIHMEFHGDMYGGPPGINQLAKVIALPLTEHLSRLVTTQDVRLTASHVVNPAPVSRGRS